MFTMNRNEFNQKLQPEWYVGKILTPHWDQDTKIRIIHLYPTYQGMKP
jgi:hypothetical protein